MDKAELEKGLWETANAAKEMSYSPYSKFRVGAAVYFDDGTIVPGANVENASFGAGICAERAALVTARMYGCKAEILAIAVTADSDEVVSPCGICRQFIREFAPLETKIYMFTRKGDLTVRTLSELLPLSFGPEKLLH